MNSAKDLKRFWEVVKDMTEVSLCLDGFEKLPRGHVQFGGFKNKMDSAIIDTSAVPGVVEEVLTRL